MVALLLAGCGLGRPQDAVSGEYLTVGTTDKVSTMDPAGSYDNGSFQVMNQVYPFLMNFVPGTGELKPDIAQRCEFSAPIVYTCVLKPNLKFANGHDLTSADVKFSFDRERTIDDPNGPQSLLANLDSIATPDPLTVDFTLKLPNDQTFPQVLATNAGPVIDDEVFPADKLLDDSAIARGGTFRRPIFDDDVPEERTHRPESQPGVPGPAGYAENRTGRAEVLRELRQPQDRHREPGASTSAWRSLSPTDIEGLRRNPNLVVHEGPGGELRYLVFNVNTMPGATPEQKLAVRKAIASTVDREALSRDVYKGTYSPAYSVMPQSIEGANEAFKNVYGARSGRGQGPAVPHRRRRSHSRRAEPAVQPRPLRGVLVGGVRRAEESARSLAACSR